MPGPGIRRMSAEQFVDAVVMLTGVELNTKPSKLENAPPRAVMTLADPLTVAMGRPNREQVVTARPTAATTLQALELTNGPTLTALLQGGASRLVEGETTTNGKALIETRLGRHREALQLVEQAIELAERVAKHHANPLKAAEARSERVEPNGQDERERWNTKYACDEPSLDPSRFLVEHADLLPRSGTALDVAGGAGRNAIWLARRGLDVTLVDISDTAVALARRAARAAGVGITAERRDVAADGNRPGDTTADPSLRWLDRFLPALNQTLFPPNRD